MDSSRGTAPSRFFFIHRFDDPLPCRWDTMNHESGTSIGWKSRPAALERCKKKQKRKAHHSIGAAIRVSVMRALCSRIWKRGVAERIDRRSIVHFGPAGDCVLLVCWFFLSSGSDDGSSIHAGRKSQLSDAIAEHRIPRNHFRFDPILRMLIVPDTVSCFYFDNPTQPTPIGSFMSSLVPFSAACPRTSMRSVVFECFFGSLLFFHRRSKKKWGKFRFGSLSDAKLGLHRVILLWPTVPQDPVVCSITCARSGMKKKQSKKETIVESRPPSDYRISSQPSVKTVATTSSELSLSWIGSL